MKIAICEDIEEDIRHLNDLLSEYLKVNFLVAEIEIFKSGEQLLEHFEEGEFQIIFQDIYMKKTELNGMETVKKIRNLDTDVAIIFTTTSIEHGIESYQVDATHYIVKPVLKEELTIAMRKCHEKIDLYAKYVAITKNRQKFRIRLCDIYYIEACQRHTFIYIKNSEFKINLPFHEFIKAYVSDYPFVPCHRSYVVNLSHISDLCEMDFVFKDKRRVPISKTFFKSAQDAFHKHFWK